MSLHNNQGFNLLASFFGFSLFWGWRWMYYYTDILVVVGGHSLPTMSMVKNLDFFFQFLVLLLAVISIIREWQPLVSDRTLIIVAAVCGTLSTPIITLAGFVAHEAVWAALTGIGWALRGVAGSAMTCLWAKIYCSVSERNACLYIALSLVLGLVITLLVAELPFTVALVLTTLLPIASTVVFDMARRNIDYQRQSYRNISNSVSGKLFPGSMNRLLASVMVVSTVFGFFMVLMAANQSGTTLLSGRISTLAPGAAGVALAAVIYFSPKMSSVGRLYAFSLPLLTVGALAYLVTGRAWTSLSSFVLVFGFMLFDTIVWIVLIDGAWRHSYPLLGAFLMGRVANTLGMFAGRLLAGLLMPLYLTSATFRISCAILIVAVLVFTSELMLHRVSMFVDERMSDEIPKADPQGTRDQFAEALEAVATRFSLSPRERDVLKLLARGKSAKQIQEALVVSSHTVNAHTYHIYQKTGVHKKAELQDLVESYMPAE